MSARKPSMVEVLRAIRRHPMDPAADEDLAAAIEMTAQVHVSTAPNADRDGNYGSCAGCAAPWPCPTWTGASYAALEWLVAASNALMRRSGTLGPAMPVGDGDLAELYERRQAA